jgi:hypothetical protein
MQDKFMRHLRESIQGPVYLLYTNSGLRQTYSKEGPGPVDFVIKIKEYQDRSTSGKIKTGQYVAYPGDYEFLMGTKDEFWGPPLSYSHAYPQTMVFEQKEICSEHRVMRCLFKGLRTPNRYRH